MLSNFLEIGILAFEIFRTTARFFLNRRLLKEQKNNLFSSKKKNSENNFYISLGRPHFLSKTNDSLSTVKLILLLYITLFPKEGNKIPPDWASRFLLPRKKKWTDLTSESLTKGFEFILEHPSLIFFCLFLFFIKKPLWALLISGQARQSLTEKVFEVIKNQQQRIVKNGKDAFQALTDWQNKPPHLYTQEELDRQKKIDDEIFLFE